MRGFVIFPVRAESPGVRCVSAAVRRMFASVADEDSVMFKVGRHSPVEEAGAEIVGGVKGVVPTVHVPIFHWGVARCWRRLEYS